MSRPSQYPWYTVHVLPTAAVQAPVAAVGPAAQHSPFEQSSSFPGPQSAIREQVWLPQVALVWQRGTTAVVVAALETQVLRKSQGP